MEIGNNIKKYRKKAGLTQKNLAKKIGCAEITVRQYESNKREPKLEMLCAIANALECSVYDLQDGILFDANTCKNSPVLAFHDLSVKKALEDANSMREKLEFKDSSGKVIGYADNLFEKMGELRSDAEIFVYENIINPTEFTSEEYRQIQAYAEFIKSQRPKPLSDKNDSENNDNDS